MSIFLIPKKNKTVYINYTILFQFKIYFIGGYNFIFIIANIGITVLFSVTLPNEGVTFNILSIYPLLKTISEDYI